MDNIGKRHIKFQANTMGTLITLEELSIIVICKDF